MTTASTHPSTEKPGTTSFPAARPGGWFPRARLARAWLLAATLALLAHAPAALRAQNTAVNFDALGSGFGYYQGAYSLGWRFTPNQDLTVTSLGFYDDLKNGLAAPHLVGIVDVATRALVVSGTVLPSDPLTGFFRFHAAAPARLSAGRDYYALAVVGQENYAVGVSHLTVGPAIIFVGFVGNNASAPTTTLDYPDAEIKGFPGDFGPGFQFTGGGGGTPPAVTVAATTPTAQAGSAPGVFTLSLSAASSVDLKVAYTLKGSAANGTDYQMLKGTAKVKAGKTSKAIQIIPLGDLGDATKKVVKLTLAPGSGYTVASPTPAKVKIAR